MNRDGPLLGEILVRDGVDQREIDSAMQAQTRARLASLIQQASGRWHSAPGENEKVARVAIQMDAWAVFFDLLEAHASPAELGFQADALLGYSVRLHSGVKMPSRTWSPEERKLLGYLEKPRRPDQLERALGRRFVRGFLRALSLLGGLELQPMSKAISIPKAVARSTRPMRAERGPTRTTIPVRPKAPHPLEKEIGAVHRSLERSNYFQILGATEKTDPTELRKKYHDLAKKYHPDTWPSEIDRSGPTAALAVEIATRVNEAYATLSNDEQRQQYVEMLRDERVRGDYRKAKQVKEAATKAKMGVVHLRKREYSKAREMFESALESDPSSGLYQAHLAWSIFSEAQQDRAAVIPQVQALLSEAVAKDDKQPLIHFYLGQVLKAKGDLSEARDQFERVVDLDPHHAPARSEIRHLERRRQDEQKKSGLSRFLSLGDRW